MTEPTDKAAADALRVLANMIADIIVERIEDLIIDRPKPELPKLLD